ncbi:hypothetical protein [Oceanobacillus piezotolerans]|nr:hypothetical protein [Oceanobacillus piezotolerans]
MTENSKDKQYDDSLEQKKKEKDSTQDIEPQRETDKNPNQGNNDN